MTVTGPAGFRAAGVTAGLKSSGAPDVAVVVNDGPGQSAAAVFTGNRCQANPVLWSRQAIKAGTARAVVVSSGGANCYTGPDGFAITHATAERAAEQLGVGAADVQVASTGLIGVLNDRDTVLLGVSTALAGLSRTGGDAAARAIMTTDTRPKQALVERDGWSVGGIAKGAGMLAPALATMLVFITTDAAIDSATCDHALRAATRTSFDRLDSDGCQSTNDTVLLMASGASGVTPAREDFTDTLSALCADLAQQLIGDAEGAEHDIEISVRGAASESDALQVARAVARSNLFKCAIFGRDPNWGRVLAAIGTTSAAFDPADLDVSLNGVAVCVASGLGDSATLVDLTERHVSVDVDLKVGTEQATVWTNDLTHAYVHENSAYST